MVTDDDTSNADTRRLAERESTGPDARTIARTFIESRDRNRLPPELETDDPVEEAIVQEMRDVKKALGESNNGTTRGQLETHMEALATKLLQHRWRRDREGNLPGDPYHRTQEEVQAESARLGAHH